MMKDLLVNLCFTSCITPCFNVPDGSSVDSCEAPEMSPETMKQQYMDLWKLKAELEVEEKSMDPKEGTTSSTGQTLVESGDATSKPPTGK